MTDMNEPDLTGIAGMEEIMQEADQYNAGLLHEQEQMFHQEEAHILGGPGGVPEGIGAMGEPGLPASGLTGGVEGMAGELGLPTSGLAGMEQLMHEADQYNAALLHEQEQMLHAAQAQILEHPGAGLDLPAGVGAPGTDPKVLAEETRMIEEVSQRREQAGEHAAEQWDKTIRDA
jgi:hypothetical protein